MELSFTEIAKNDLDKLSPEIREKVNEKLCELKKKPGKNQNTKLININGNTLFRLKIGERNGKLDHRAIFDIKNNKVVLMNIIHRDEGYHEL